MSHNQVFLLEPENRNGRHIICWPGERHTRQRAWVNAGSITAVVAAGQAPIDDDKRADADIVALDDTKKVIYEPDNGTVNLEFRFRADGSEDDVYPIQMLTEAGVDRYTKVSDLACTQGTQEADDTAYFIDAMTRSNYKWETPIRIVAAEANYIARCILNTHGHDGFLFVCTDLQNATNLYVDVRRAS